MLNHSVVRVIRNVLLVQVVVQVSKVIFSSQEARAADVQIKKVRHSAQHVCLAGQHSS